MIFWLNKPEHLAELFPQAEWVLSAKDDLILTTPAESSLKVLI